jgi:hypothetical protein
MVCGFRGWETREGSAAVPDGDPEGEVFVPAGGTAAESEGRESTALADGGSARRDSFRFSAPGGFRAVETWGTGTGV